MKASHSYYDAVFLGTRFGALLSAALLAKRGFRVLVLGQDEPSPTYRIADYELPRAPYDFLAAHSPVARRVLSELALHQMFRRRATSMDPAFQVALPGHRFDLPLDEELLDRELEREFPEVRRAVEDFHRTLAGMSGELDGAIDRDLVWPPDGFLERREFARAFAHQPFDRQGGGWDPLAELPDDHPFRLGVLAPVRFASHLDPSHLPHLSATRLYWAWLRGSACLDGGYAWLRQALFEKIRTYSGDIRPTDRADRVLLRRGSAAGVRIARSGEEVGATFVIAACDAGRLMRLVPDRSPFEESFERVGEPQPRWFRYTLNLVVRAEGIPEGMGRDVFLVVDRQRPLGEENLLHLENHPPDAEGRRLLCVEALLPRRGIEEVTGYLESIRDRVLDSVRALIPFLDKHLEIIDSPHDGRDAEAPLKGTSYGSEAPWTRGPIHMRPVWGFPHPGALGVCGLPVRTSVRRLLLCNEQVVPGLGEEGTFLTAWSVARVVTRSDRKKEWMRRGLWTKVEI